MLSRFQLAIAGVLAAVLTTGCSRTAPGNPTPWPSSDAGATAGTVTASPSPGPLPARPREIRLESLDPCILWTTEQLSQLGLVTRPDQGTTTAGDTACVYEAQDRQPPKISFTLSTVLDHDVADQFLPSHGDTVIDVAGFPAVRQPASAAGLRPCSVLVSTSQGQFLSVWLNYGSTENHLPGEQACELTTKAATFAMQTLQTQR